MSVKFEAVAVKDLMAGTTRIRTWFGKTTRVLIRCRMPVVDDMHDVFEVAEHDFIEIPDECTGMDAMMVMARSFNASHILTIFAKLETPK